MPVRLLRPGLTTSERFNACEWFTQSLYVRLLTLVDDFGRYDANERILKSHAFPLSDDVTLDAIVKSCNQLSANGLVEFYECDGKKYLQLTRWQERVRAKVSKFPPNADTCEQMTADASKCPPPTPYALRLTPSPSPSPTPARENAPVEASLPFSDSPKQAKKKPAVSQMAVNCQSTDGQLSVNCQPPVSQVTPDCHPPATQLPPACQPPAAKKPAGEHRQMIDAWCQAYEEAHGSKFIVTNRDGKAAKDLLASGVKPDEVASLATAAWANKGKDSWNCQNRTATLYDFADAFMKIRQEVSKAGGSSSAPVGGEFCENWWNKDPKHMTAKEISAYVDR